MNTETRKSKMKSIRRLDENLDSRRNRIKELIEERNCVSSEAYNKAQKEWNESTNGIELNKLQQEEYNYNLEQTRKREKEFSRQLYKEYIKEYSANRKDTKFKYAQRVIIVNPLKEGCGKHTEDMKGLKGRIRNIGGCKCIHAVSKQCYYVGITSTGEKIHFEECELDFARREK